MSLYEQIDPEIQTVMEKKNFNYSMKNIPIPTQNSYMKSMIAKTESLLRRMRWKVFWYEQDQKKNRKDRSEETEQHTYGFNTENAPPKSPALAHFEDDIFNMLNNIKYNSRRSEFQKQLSKDMREVRASPSVFVPADKTTNIYKLSPESYNKLLHENVTANHKKTNNSTLTKINSEAKQIATKLKLQDRIERIAEKPAFITLKDHKDNFENVPKCRLLNPAKSEIGVVSKHRLQIINEEIREQTGLSQWRNTQTALNWFKNIRSKGQSRFIQLDIDDFYPSITEELLMNSIAFARTVTEIDPDTIEIILHSRRSLLFSNNSAWSKKDGNLFDVSMGSFDGAEVCELVGLFILHQMKDAFPSIDFGLYRDDGLGCYKRIPGPRAERIRKDIIQLFKNNGLSITIVMNACIVNFLDVTLNLTTGKHAPYRKPNDTPLYIHKDSNHPRNIINRIPDMIQSRLSDLSSDAKEFNNAKDDYVAALSNSGFDSNLQFSKSKPTLRKNRKRNIIWFNPPFNQAVENNIGKEFTSLLEKHFPRHHKYRKLFNRSNVRLSYSCTPNVQSIIQNHNRKILQEPVVAREEQQSCSCTANNKANCPLDNQCMRSAITYKAVVDAGEGVLDQQYLGATESPWKLRFGNHKQSFLKEHKRNESSLSIYLWELKERGINANVTWSIDAQSFPYRCGSRKCDLCLTEKLAILKSDSSITLNKRSEILNKCRHAAKFKLNRV